MFRNKFNCLNNCPNDIQNEDDPDKLTMASTSIMGDVVNALKFWLMEKLHFSTIGNACGYSIWCIAWWPCLF